MTASIDRQKTELGADPARLCSQFARVVDRLLHRIDGAGRIGLRLRHPERIVFLLKAFHAMPEITRLLPGALGIDEHRQIAAQSHRIHGLEEKGAMAAEQVLHIVLRGRDQDVDPGLVHQTIQAIRIERDRGCNLLDDVEHDQSSLWIERSAPCTGRAWVSGSLRSYTNTARSGHAPAAARAVPATPSRVAAAPARRLASLGRVLINP